MSQLSWGILFSVYPAARFAILFMVGLFCVALDLGDSLVSGNGHDLMNSAAQFRQAGWVVPRQERRKAVEAALTSPS